MKKILLIVMFFNIYTFSCLAYQAKAHRAITDSAIKVNRIILNVKLKNVKIDGGVLEILKEGLPSPTNPVNISDFIQYGGVMEDEPFRAFRFKNHFYSPTTNAGLNDYFNGLSSYGWANDATNNWSWQSAHTNYLIGLTAPTKEERNASLALAFRSLGQVMHLLQDKAVPAHVRNDVHPSPDPYEDYVENHLANYIGASIYYDGVLGSGEAVPVQLWDSGRYNGTNPLFTLTPNIGLSEYTNANFASKDTIFTENYLIDEDPFNDRHYFPFPRFADTQTYIENTGSEWDGYPIYREYFEKINGGTVVKYFATSSRLYLPYYFDTPYDYNVIYSLDDKCHVDYAEKLIPRAVGYSATLLQYFFRGDISMTVAPDNAGKYVVENLSDEAMSGTFSLYADDADGNRTIVEGSTITMDIPAHGLQRIEAFLPPVTEDAAVGYLLVFVGTLGQEEGAVTAVKVDVPPPTPIMVQEDPAPGWNRYQVVNNSGQTISGDLTLRYVSSGIDKPVEDVSWPVTLAPGEQVEVDAFTPPEDADSPDQYQLVFKGIVNGEPQSLLYNRITIPAIKPGWIEEWNNGLAGSHAWLSTGLDYPSSNLSNGITTSFVDNGRLVKENTRTVATKAGRVNETTMRVPIVNASGQYCLSSYSSACVPYNFGAEFPLPITPNTVLRVKVDEMFISSEVLQYDTCAVTGYGQYQGIRFLFDNGVSLSFTQEGQEPPDRFQANVTPGVEFDMNIFQAFAAAGQPFVAPVHLKSVNVVQSLGSLCSPSTTEHQQRIKVDYIRMEEDPNYVGY